MSEIKVGSEWVHADGNKYRVTATGVHSVLLYSDESKREFSVVEEVLISSYKHAPVRRTVWLNVYEGHAVSYNSKQSADLNTSNAVLFQQEVELIDPSKEGGE